MKKVRLDVDLIPEMLYEDLLTAFKQEYGEGCYNEWTITAVKE